MSINCKYKNSTCDKDFKSLYCKYKNKYLNLKKSKKNLKGGSIRIENLVENLLNQAIRNIASLNKIKDLVEKKNCQDNNYKYCTNGINIGYCINVDSKCSNIISDNKKYLSEFSKILLELEENKITYDDFDYKEKFNNSFDLKYKLPPEKANQEYNYLVRIDINKLKEYMGEDNTDSMAHRRIYTKKNIEYLAWILAGLHAQDLNSKIVNGEQIQIIESFLKYYFTNPNSFLKVPIIRTDGVNNYFEIQDGRHRLAFYSYFNIDGFVLTDIKGLKILQDNFILLEFKELEVQELVYFEEEIFKTLQDIDQRIQLRNQVIPNNSNWKVICRRCQGNHPTYQHSNYA